MSRRYRLLVLAFAAVLLVVFRAELYLTPLVEVAQPSFTFTIVHGTPVTPVESANLSGDYYRGDGTGYNLSLALHQGGTYAASWYGCVGLYGTATGEWALASGDLKFTPIEETEMMQGHLRSLEPMAHAGHWILVPTEDEDREVYDKWGVSEYSCFQATLVLFSHPGQLPIQWPTE